MTNNFEKESYDDRNLIMISSLINIDFSKNRRQINEQDNVRGLVTFENKPASGTVEPDKLIIEQV